MDSCHEYSRPYDAAYHQWVSPQAKDPRDQLRCPLRHSDIGSGAGQCPATHGPREEYPGVLRPYGIDDQRHGSDDAVYHRCDAVYLHNTVHGRARPASWSRHDSNDAAYHRSDAVYHHGAVHGTATLQVSDGTSKDNDPLRSYHGCRRPVSYYNCPMNPVEGERRDSEEYDRPEVCVKEFDLADTPMAFRGENALGN